MGSHAVAVIYSLFRTGSGDREFRTEGFRKIIITIRQLCVAVTGRSIVTGSSTDAE